MTDAGVLHPETPALVSTLETDGCRQQLIGPDHCRAARGHPRMAWIYPWHSRHHVHCQHHIHCRHVRCRHHVHPGIKTSV
jgi:hypothetical protein